MRRVCVVDKCETWIWANDYGDSRELGIAMEVMVSLLIWYGKRFFFVVMGSRLRLMTCEPSIFMKMMQPQSSCSVSSCLHCRFSTSWWRSSTASRSPTTSVSTSAPRSSATSRLLYPDHPTYYTTNPDRQLTLFFSSFISPVFPTHSNWFPQMTTTVHEHSHRWEPWL